MKKKVYGYFLCGVLLCTLSLFFLNGCGQNSREKDGDKAVAETEDAADNTQEASADQDEEADQAGQVVFEGQDVEGNVVSSSVFAQSKLTMVNVWATYCNPCLMEMPGLGELASEYDPEEFQLIGIISDVQEGAGEKNLEYAAGLIEQTGADYPHLLLNESLYRGLLTEVSAVPTTFFFDENGAVLDVVVGAMEKSAWEKKINDLLGK